MNYEVTEELMKIDAARMVASHYGNTSPSAAGIEIEAGNIQARWDISKDHARAIIKQVIS